MHFKWYRGILVGIILFNFLISDISIKGQLSYRGVKGNDAIKGSPSFESSIIYIPTFSLFRELKNNQAFDIELAYRSLMKTPANQNTNLSTESYRGWLRYTNPELELRLGLQKIIFGPSQILRPLAWFDTLNFNDPLNQTEGVKAFRLNWVPSQKIYFISWLIADRTFNIQPGFRIEMDHKLGQLGTSIHNFQISDEPVTTQFGLDYRYDGIVGFWSENSFDFFDQNKTLTNSMIGLDYTLPFFTGITFMMEYSQTTSNHILGEQAVLVSTIPISMNNSIVLISSRDLLHNHTFNYFRLNSYYDKFSINYMVSINPKRSEYPISQNSRNSVVGFGTNFQISIIYNH